MIIVAFRQLRGTYGTLLPGEYSDVPDDIARDLISRDLAGIPKPEDKSTTPPESAALPKRSTKTKKAS